jgi:hypothetical protein
MGGQEAIWLRQLMQELKPELSPTKINCKDIEVIKALPSSTLMLHCDNQSAIKLAKNPAFILELNIYVCSTILSENALLGRSYQSSLLAQSTNW